LSFDTVESAERRTLRIPQRRIRQTADVERHRPVHVVWEITLACNLRCGHCGSRAGRPRANELSTEECLDVVRQLKELGTREVSLIGGEAYLRRDWLVIAKAIADAGMLCSVQTGARALTPEKIRQAVDAGIRAIGVSIDGPRHVHDELRGVRGSYDQAIAAVGNVAAAGLAPGVNTQINALSVPYLREIFDAIIERGARSWQVQLTVAMGNAVDNADLIIQPYLIPGVVDTLFDLYERGIEKGLRLIPGNSIGYFGPYEVHWRTLTDQPEHWGGCTAGETTLGLEADGLIKGCPSLPGDAYSGGASREVSISDAIDALARRTVRRDGNRGAGFCKSCYYWSVCRGGCTWVSHVLRGRRGNNPFCYYRARELEKQGIRERIVKVAEAPGLPFDIGRFRIVAEDASGRRVPASRIRDDKKRGRGRKLVVCETCHEYYFAGEAFCPHCAAQDRPVAMQTGALKSDILGYLAEIELHERGMAGVLTRLGSQ
jgi:radical SAM protein with 4Fe4S-binding SPASM domain